MMACVRSTLAAAESRVASAVSTRRLGRIALHHKHLLARQRLVGVGQLRAAVGEVRLLDRIVDIDERRAGRDVVARLEMDRGHNAGRLRRDGDALKRAQRADRRQLRGPFLDSRRFDRHGGRLRREGGGHETLDQVGLDDELEIGEPPGQRDEKSEHDQKHQRPASPGRQGASRDEREHGPVCERSHRSFPVRGVHVCGVLQHFARDYNQGPQADGSEAGRRARPRRGRAAPRR